MICPSDEADLSEAIAGARGGLRVSGGGTRDVGRPVAGTTLSVAGISGITLYEPGALTLVARAGTPLSEIEATLAAEGQRLAFEPMDHRGLLGTDGTPTVGGVVAANVSGPRRVQTGACRDSLLGVRFVDGTGAAVASGGRVMKNVTGIDLARLLAGSWGTLGVLSEVALKVLPAPEAVASVEVEGLGSDRAVEAMVRGLGTPWEITGAAHDACGADGAGRTMLRLEGFEASVGYRSRELAAALAAFGRWNIRKGEGAETRWRAVRDVSRFHDRPGAVWRVSLKPTDGPRLLQELRGAGLAHEALLDWGGGLAWVRLPEPGEDAAAGPIRAAVNRMGGHATLVRAERDLRARVRVFHPEAPAVAELSRGLRARFDPRGVLNPGLLG